MQSGVGVRVLLKVGFISTVTSKDIVQSCAVLILFNNFKDEKISTASGYS